jgi:hypothetical protein
LSPRAARRGGRPDPKSAGPNATLSLWGEPGEPEGYDPGAPTGPLEVAELAVMHQQVEEARAEEAGPVEEARAAEVAPLVEGPHAEPGPADAGLGNQAGGDSQAGGDTQAGGAIDGGDDEESQAARTAHLDVQGGTIPETSEKMEYPREVVPPAELVITMSSGEGTELPHWADPPTGEVRLESPRGRAPGMEAARLARSSLAR